MQSEGWIERFVRGPAGDELDADEETAAPNVAHRVADGIDCAQRLAQRLPQRGSVTVDTFDQTVAFDDALHGCTRGARERVPRERVSRHRPTRDAVEHVGDATVVQGGTQ